MDAGAGVRCEMERSEKARRVACNRGGMVCCGVLWLAVYSRAACGDGDGGGGGDVQEAEILGAKLHSRSLSFPRRQPCDYSPLAYVWYRHAPYIGVLAPSIM
jgi:hypothetical protein